MFTSATMVTIDGVMSAQVQSQGGCIHHHSKTWRKTGPGEPDPTDRLRRIWTQLVQLSELWLSQVKQGQKNTTIYQSIEGNVTVSQYCDDCPAKIYIVIQVNKKSFTLCWDFSAINVLWPYKVQHTQKNQAKPLGHCSRALHLFFINLLIDNIFYKALHSVYHWIVFD